MDATEQTPPPRRKRRFSTAFALLAGLALISVAGWQLQSRLAFAKWLERPLGFPQESINVTIERGMTAREIGNRLVEEGVMPSLDHFRRLVIHTGGQERLRAGRFAVTPDLTPVALVDLLQSGTGGGIRVTLVEGWTTLQMAEELVEAGLAENHAQVLAVVASNERRNAITDLETAQGYLYPDTYLFVPGQSAEEVVDHLVESFVEAVDLDGYRASAEALGLTLDEAVTLASIIEREARSDAERPHIAGVFLNRLASNMRLESCATVHYALGDWSRALTIADTEIDHPYNTYEITGLPPGPICNPGLPSLMAVVSAEETKDLYFVYDPALGAHRFSETYRAHQRAISDVRNGQRVPSAAADAS